MIGRHLLCVAGAVAFATASIAEPVVLRGARIMTADNAGTIEAGAIVINDGRIVAVGSSVVVPPGAREIDLSGRTITPGFIATDSVIGMVEISGGADAAESSSRTGRITAGYDVQYTINPLSTTIPVARKGGVSRAIIMPRPGPGNASFAGQAAILSLRETTELDVVPQVGAVWDMRIGAYGRGATFVQFRVDLADVRRYMRDPSLFAKGELTARDWSRPDLEALIPIVKGEKPIAIRVDQASDILTLIDIASSEKIRLVLVGAAEAWVVADRIRQAGIPVAIDPSDNLPGSFDQMGVAAENAARLDQAGVTLIIRGGSAAHDAGKVRLFAGMAIARGVPADVALRAVTVTPARIWGASDFGSIAPGQSADLAVWSGDPFEPMTELTALYISGEPQGLTSRQDALERRYIPAARTPAGTARAE